MSAYQKVRKEDTNEDTFIGHNPMFPNNEGPQIDPNENSCDMRFHRLFLCILAVALVWFTSLLTAISIVNYFIPAPTLTSVKDTCYLSYDVIKEQSDMYQKCGKIQVSACNKQLEKSLEKEINRISKIQSRNEKLYNNLLLSQQNCSFMIGNFKEIIRTWLSIPAHFVPYNHFCSTDELEKIRLFLGDTSTDNMMIESQTKDKMYQLTISNLREKDQIINSLLNYTKSMETYYTNFIIQQRFNYRKQIPDALKQYHNAMVRDINETFTKVNMITSNYSECFGLTNSSTSVCNIHLTNNSIVHRPGVKHNYGKLQITMNSQLQMLYYYFSLNSKKIQNFESAVANAGKNAVNFFKSITDVTGLISYIQNKFSVPLDSLCKVSDWCNFSEDMFYVNFPILSPFPNLFQMPDSESLLNGISSFQSQQDKEISDSNINLIKNANIHALLLENKILGIIGLSRRDDTQAPKIPIENGNISKISEVNHENSKNFIIQLGNLSAIHQQSNNLNSSKIISEATSLIKQYNLTGLVSQIKYSSAKFAWTSIDTSGIELNIVLLSISNVAYIMTVLDTIYRVIYSLYICKKHWDSSSVKIPPIDIRLERSIYDNTTYISIKYILKLVPFFWCQILFMIAMVTLILWFMSYIFLYEYTSYVRGCVVHSAQDTFISSKLKAAAYNYAAYSGNEIINQGIGNYNYISSKQCAQSQTNSQQNFINFVANTTNINQTFNIEIKNLHLSNKCINLTSFDQDYSTACCKYHSKNCSETTLKCPLSLQSNTSYVSLPGEYLDDSNINFFCNNTWEIFNIENTIFNCANIPMCDISCEGPRKEITDDVSKACSCMAEWYLNSNILQILMGISIYILGNISRILFIDGILRIFWELFTPKLFEYKANCDDTGQLVLKSKKIDNQNDNQSEINNDELRKEIKKASSSFIHRGYIYVVIGIVLNLIWVLLLVILHANIVYEPI